MKTSLIVPVLFVLLTLAITPSQSLAECYTGNDLVALMPEWDRMYAKASRVDLAKAFEFGAYVLGVCDATMSLYTIPTGADQGQIIAAVSKYLKAHPKELSGPAAPLVTKALGQAFPKK